MPETTTPWCVDFEHITGLHLHLPDVLELLDLPVSAQDPVDARLPGLATGHAKGTTKIGRASCRERV